VSPTLSTAEALDDSGLELPRPNQPQWPALQDLGQQLASDGYPGVLAPSASRPGSLVLCLFRHADAIAGAVPVRPPTTSRRAPAPPTGMTM
jgi:hypothetical protein